LLRCASYLLVAGGQFAMRFDRVLKHVGRCSRRAAEYHDTHAPKRASRGMQAWSGFALPAEMHALGRISLTK